MPTKAERIAAQRRAMDNLTKGNPAHDPTYKTRMAARKVEVFENTKDEVEMSYSVSKPKHTKASQAEVMANLTKGNPAYDPTYKTRMASINREVFENTKDETEMRCRASKPRQSKVSQAQAMANLTKGKPAHALAYEQKKAKEKHNAFENVEVKVEIEQQQEEILNKPRVKGLGPEYALKRRYLVAG